MYRTVLSSLVFSCLLSAQASAQIALDNTADIDLTTLSLEDLMEIEVTSVSKRAQSLRETPSAVFVISDEDIRRSGLRTLPEILRMAPGVEVGQIRSNDWAVTIRGFNGQFANKLLILIDGRTVYTPFWGGVLWDAQSTLIEDIERIEVIRGPGAAIWGANAVNGVINIITKSATKTQGALIVTDADSDGGWRTSARWGHSVRDNLAYRGYVQHQRFGSTRAQTFDNLDRIPAPPGTSAQDEWSRSQAGLRLDWEPTPDDLVRLDGQIYEGNTAGFVSRPTPTSPFDVTQVDDGEFSGGSVQVSWDRIVNIKTDISLSASYEHFERVIVNNLPQSQDTFDLTGDLVHTTDAGIALQAGFGYRRDKTDIQPSRVGLTGLEVLPSIVRKDDRFSGYLQAEVPFFDNQVLLTAGSKFEDNEFSGFEVQPTVRALFAPSQDQTFWASFSRAVRTPARLDFDPVTQSGLIPPGDPLSFGPLLTSIRLTGAPTPQTLDAENLESYEVGYRTEFANGLSLDIAGYYNKYSDLLNRNVGTPFIEFDTGVPLLVVPIAAANNARATNKGVEAYLDWPVADTWQMSLTYSYLDSKTIIDGPTFAVNQLDRSALSPKHQAGLRTHFDLTNALDLDIWARYVDNLGTSISDYVGLNVRLGWQVTDGIHFEVLGQNLLDKERANFNEPFRASPISSIQRKVTARLTARF